jgi:hypothetical protein
MPQQAQNNQKATSPSKLVQHGVDQDWGAQQRTSTDAQGALKDQYNKHPMDVPKK